MAASVLPKPSVAGCGGLWPRQEGSSLAAPSLSQLLETRPPKPPFPESIHHCIQASLPSSPTLGALLSSHPFWHSGALAHLLCLVRLSSFAGTAPVKTSGPPASPVLAQPPATPSRYTKVQSSCPVVPRLGLLVFLWRPGGYKHWEWGLVAEGRLRVHKFRMGVFPGPWPTAGGGKRPRPPASPVGFLAAGCSWLPRSISSVRAPATPTPPLHSLDCHVRPHPGLPGSLFQTRDTGQC